MSERWLISRHEYLPIKTGKQGSGRDKEAQISEGGGLKNHWGSKEKWGIKGCAVLPVDAKFPDRPKRALLVYHATSALLALHAVVHLRMSPVLQNRGARQGDLIGWFGKLCLRNGLCSVDPDLW